MLQPGDPFPNLKLDTSAGRVELKDRWREGPLVVMFMRHFGCPFCREHLMRMGRALPQFEAEGAQLAAIFQYGAEATEAFCESRDVPFDCLADPLREAYGEVTLGRGKRKNLYTWGVAKAVVRNAAAGNFGGRPKGGNRNQMPGTFVIGTDGRVRLAHYNASSEDNPSVERVLDAVRREPLA